MNYEKVNLSGILYESLEENFIRVIKSRRTGGACDRFCRDGKLIRNFYCKNTKGEFTWEKSS
jgi:hypothetical protein